MILILIFAEVLGQYHITSSGKNSEIQSLIRRAGLYGLIVALLMNSRAKQDVEPCR